MPRGGAFTTTTRLAGAAASLALVLPGAALADETITAEFQNRYGADSYEIDQGEKVFFTNNDFARHNVEANQSGFDNKPLFYSDLIENGQTAQVTGTEYLSTGSYQFFCTIHTFMQGTLVVNANGAPLQRPGADAPPALSLAVVRGTLEQAVKSGRIKVRAKVDRQATVSLLAKAKIGGRTKTIAKGRSSFAGARKKTVTLKLTKAARRALKGKRSAKVTVTGTATGAGGKGTDKRSAKFR